MCPQRGEEGEGWRQRRRRHRVSAHLLLNEEIDDLALIWDARVWHFEPMPPRHPRVRYSDAASGMRPEETHGKREAPAEGGCKPGDEAVKGTDGIEDFHLTARTRTRAMREACNGTWAGSGGEGGGSGTLRRGRTSSILSGALLADATCASKSS